MGGNDIHYLRQVCEAAALHLSLSWPLEAHCFGNTVFASRPFSCLGSIVIGNRSSFQLQFQPLSLS